MSRTFEVNIHVIGINKEQLGNIVEQELGTMKLVSQSDNCEMIGLSDIIQLCRGELEEQAHNRLSEAIKEINPDAKVQTTWVYLDDLPHEIFGDDLYDESETNKDYKDST